MNLFTLDLREDVAMKANHCLKLLSKFIRLTIIHLEMTLTTQLSRVHQVKSFHIGKQILPYVSLLRTIGFIPWGKNVGMHDMPNGGLTIGFIPPS